jgi:hypothetical protein
MPAKFSRASMVAVLVCGAAALGQPANTVKPNATPGPGNALFPAGSVEFAEEPLRLDAVGLSMQVPLESQIKAARGAGVQNLQILGGDGSWMVNVRTPLTSNPKSTTQEAMAETIKMLQYSVGVTDSRGDKVVETQAQVLEEVATLTINGQAASRCYVSVPGQGANKRVVKGYTFFKPSPKQYVVFELVVPGEAYNRVRTVYETVLATATFADPTAVTASYAAAVKAGVRLFEQVEEADIVAAIGKGEQFHRLYRPASGGAKGDAAELGYRSLRFWRGKRGEVDAKKKAGDLKSAESDEGYLCQLTVRLLDGKNTIDTVARYFMTPDRGSESWSVVMVRTDDKGRELGRWEETGARAGDEVRVIVVQPGTANKPIEPFIQGEGYISQFESYLLPSLLMHKAVTDGVEAEFGFYSYRSESEGISLRRDTVARDTASGGAWTITTKFRDDSRPQKSVFNDRGDLIRTELPDGRLWEPIDVQALTRLWQSKGLPTKK